LREGQADNGSYLWAWGVRAVSGSNLKKVQREE
jgi:hypothetical protein